MQNSLPAVTDYDSYRDWRAATNPLVIWLSPAVALDQQPAMVGDEVAARC